MAGSNGRMVADLNESKELRIITEQKFVCNCIQCGRRATQGGVGKITTLRGGGNEE